MDMNEEFERHDLNKNLDDLPPKEKRKCLCCGKQFEVCPHIIQDFCDSCFPIVCKAVFDKSNDNLTRKQLEDKIRMERRLDRCLRKKQKSTQ